MLKKNRIEFQEKTEIEKRFHRYPSSIYNLERTSLDYLILLKY